MQNALDTLKSGSPPVVYSAEVEADSHQLEEIAKDQRSFALDRSSLVSGNAVLQRTPMPEGCANLQINEQSAHMGTQEMLSTLAAIRNGSFKELTK
jgi:hypothetical protein